MVETRGSRRRSESNLDDDKEHGRHYSQPVDLATESKHSHIGVSVNSSDYDVMKEKSRKISSAETVSTAAKTAAQRSRLDTTIGSARNELSRLLPGYTAPLRLTRKDEKPSLSLTELRKQALVSNAPTLTGASRDKRMQAPTASVLLHTTRYGGLPSSYSQVCSFKKPIKPARRDDAGGGWFGMRPTPLDDALKKDLAVLRNRHVLDPKRFYKSADKHAGHMVQVGMVVEGPTEFYSSRLTNKQRQGNMVDELLYNGEADYASRKYKAAQQERTEKALQRKRLSKRQRGGPQFKKKR